MFSIGQFFERIRSKYAQEIFIRTVIKESLKKIANIDVAVEDISLSGSSVSIKKLNQSARSVMYIKKQSMLEAINSAQSISNITDIR